MGTQSQDGLEATLAVFDDTAEVGEPLTTREVTDQLDCTRRTAYDRLNRLVDRGELNTKKVGARGRIWWRPSRATSGDGNGEMAVAGDGDGGAFTSIGATQFESLVDDISEYALFILDAAGRVRSWNQGAERIKGYEAGEILGKHVSAFYTVDEREANVPERNLRTAATEGSLEEEGWRVRKDGSQFRARVTITAIRDDAGGVAGYVKVTRDRTRKHREQARLVRQRDELERELSEVFERVDDNFVAVDESFRLTYVTERTAALLGASVGELVGETLWDASTAVEEAELRGCFERAFETQDPVDYEGYLDVGDRWLSLVVYPSETGLSVYLRDATVRRERGRELEQYEAALETIGDGVYIVNENSEFLFVNDAHTELTGYDREELLGSHASLVTTGKHLETAERHRDELTETDDDLTTLETELVTKEGERIPVETQFALFPVGEDSDGRVGVVRDITARRERERQLERYGTIVETVSDGVYALDDESRFEVVNEAYAEMMGHDREALVGAHVSTVVDEDVVADWERRRQELVDGRSHGVAEIELTTDDGDSITVESRYARLPSDGEEFRGAVGVVRNVTDRTEREEQLQARIRQQEAVTELGQLALECHDVDRLMARASELVAGTLDTDYCKLLDLAAADEELLLRQGVGWDEGIVGEATVSAVDDSSQAAYTLRTERPVVVEDLGTERRFSGPELLTSHDIVSGISTIIGSMEEPWGILGVHDTARRTFTEHDVNFVQSVAHILAAAIDRHERERELELYETIVETIDDGVYVLDGEYTFTKVNQSYAEMMGYDREELLGAHCSLVVGDDVSTAAADRSQSLIGTDEHATLEAEIERDDGSTFVAESRFTPLPSCPDDDDAFTGTVGVVRDTTERRRRERELERQREQLAALNDLSAVTRGITDAVIAQSTREEVEQLVCDRLADAETYQFAWMGELDRSLDAVRVKAVAGCPDVAGAELPVDSEAADGYVGMVAAALRTQTVHVRRGVDANGWEVTDGTTFQTIHDELGIQSTVVIPIVHDRTVFGVLTLSTDRPHAFEGDERATIGHLGEIIGHALASIERKRALMSDEVVELQFRSEGGELGIDSTMTGTVSIDGTVAIEADRYLTYGTVTDDALDTLEEITAVNPHWEELTVRGSDAGDATSGDRGERRFELVVSEPPVTSAVAAQGGDIVDARIVDGTIQFTFHLPPSADVRAIIDVVQSTYPETEMMTRRQRPRDDSRSATSVEATLAEALTDRQRAALKASYHAGFFEWPRARSGEEVADSLDISPSTFHQHLRAAERKVFRSLLA